MGMFELNNMGLLLSSPVEDYFLAVDNLEEGSEKQAVLRVRIPRDRGGKWARMCRSWKETSFSGETRRGRKRNLGAVRH